MYHSCVCLAVYWSISLAKAESYDIRRKVYDIAQAATYAGLVLLEAGFGLFIWSMYAAATVQMEDFGFKRMPRFLILLPACATIAGLLVFGTMSWLRKP